MPFMSKYVIEATLILGGVLVGGIQFVLTDAAEAVGRITIFLLQEVESPLHFCVLNKQQFK